jgi:hypothetical protein
MTDAWMCYRHEETWHMSVASEITIVRLMLIYVYPQMLAAMRGQMLVIHMT